MSTGKAFDRIFIIMFENENAEDVMKNAYFAQLAKQGCQLTNSLGVTHPSQPNYIATIGGDFFNWAKDSCTTFDETNLVDLMEKAGVSWTAYIEDLPYGVTTEKILSCEGSDVSDKFQYYYRKHNPFISFQDNQTTDRLKFIVNAQQNFDPNNLPQFAWYGPNIQNCGHTVPGSKVSGGSLTNINFAANWLQGFLDPLLQNQTFMDGTLIVLTFDEDWPQKPIGQPESGDPIYTVLLGSMISAGTTQTRNYTHYNLLATIEKNFNLGNLGRNDATADPFNFLWDTSSTT